MGAAANGAHQMVFLAENLGPRRAKRMLDSTKSSQFNPDKTISGRGLKHRIAGMTIGERAAFAADLVSGRVRLEPSVRQACALAGVGPALVREILRRRAKAQEQAAATKATVTRPRSASSPSPIEVVTRAWSTMSDLEREQTIREFGVAATWDALSRVVA
jgi:hypothetical protein